MEMHHVDRGAIAVWRWVGAAIVAVALVGTSFFAWRVGEGPPIALPIMVIVAGSFIAWFYPVAYYRRLVYGVDETGLVIQSGLLWRSQRALPRARIQHSDVAQGPLQRRFGVGTLKLYTAGSRHTKIELPGLAHADALALRDELLARDGSGV
jgi:uncharacterized protein